MNVTRSYAILFLAGLVLNLAACGNDKSNGTVEPQCEQTCAPALAGTTGTAVTLEVYTDRAQFEARLQGCLELVDFDDVDTSGPEMVSIAADRYAGRGIIITGTDGQYVDESFDYPDAFPPLSPPNMYAPGPPALSSDPSGTGGHETQVSFVACDEPAAVAGFGAVFIDADYPAIGQSSLTVYDEAGNVLHEEPVSGGNAEPLFRGVVAVDGDGKPVSGIHKVRLVNGNNWVRVLEGEGVTLDDFVFSVPRAPSSGLPVLTPDVSTPDAGAAADTQQVDEYAAPLDARDTASTAPDTSHWSPEWLDGLRGGDPSVDLDGDGQDDLWQENGDDGKLQHLLYDADGDGQPDLEVWIEGGEIEYQADWNGDGAVDAWGLIWETGADSFVEEETRDTDGNGVPDLLERKTFTFLDVAWELEEDPDEDGVFTPADSGTYPRIQAKGKPCYPPEGWTPDLAGADEVIEVPTGYGSARIAVGSPDDFMCPKETADALKNALEEVLELGSACLKAGSNSHAMKLHYTLLTDNMYFGCFPNATDPDCKNVAAFANEGSAVKNSENNYVMFNPDVAPGLQAEVWGAQTMFHELLHSAGLPGHRYGPDSPDGRYDTIYNCEDYCFGPAPHKGNCAACFGISGEDPPCDQLDEPPLEWCVNDDRYCHCPGCNIFSPMEDAIICAVNCQSECIAHGYDDNGSKCMAMACAMSMSCDCVNGPNPPGC